MTICGTPGSAMICVFAVVAMPRSFLMNRRWPAVTRSAGPLVLLVPLLLLVTFVLQVREQDVESVVALVPVRAVAGQPRGRLAERLRFEVAEAGGGLAAARDQAGLFEHFEVAGDGRL